MSELKVNLIQPATSSIVTVTPSLEVKNTTGSVLMSIDNNSVTITSPLYTGSDIDKTAGIAFTVSADRTSVGVNPPQHLTSRGDGLPPVWTEGVPYGAIIMWWGLPTNVPTGWILCDGGSVLVSGLTWRTPDLRDRFIVGAGNLYSAGSIGGYRDATLVQHTHAITPNPHNHGNSNHAHTRGCEVDCDDDGQHTWPPYNLGDAGNVTLSLSTVGESATNKNLPPYHALCFIMRVPTS